MDKATGAGQTTHRFLEQDHASLGNLFAELQPALNEGQAGRAFELLDLIWARLAIHIRAEHLCLFPALLNTSEQSAGTPPPLAPKEVQEVIERLRLDHDFFMHELASAVNTLRSLKDSKDVSKGGLREVSAKVYAVCARLNEHNRIEEEQAYKWVALLLTEEEQANLLARVEREFEKLPPRFLGRDMFPAD